MQGPNSGLPGAPGHPTRRELPAIPGVGRANPGSGDPFLRVERRVETICEGAASEVLGLGQGWEVMGLREPESSTWNNPRRSHRHRPVLAREQPRAWLGVEQHCSVWVSSLPFC